MYDFHCTTGQLILNSEWHALFECPSHEAARGRFALATCYSRAAQIENTSEELKDIVTYTRNCARRSGELAKLLLNIRTTRRCLHRQLTSNGLKGRARVLRQILWGCWRATLA